MQQCHSDMQLLMLARQQQAQLGRDQIITPAAASQPQEAASLTEQLIKGFRVMPMQVGCCSPSARHLPSAAQGWVHAGVTAAGSAQAAGASMCTGAVRAWLMLSVLASRLLCVHAACRLHH